MLCSVTHSQLDKQTDLKVKTQQSSDKLVVSERTSTIQEGFTVMFDFAAEPENSQIPTWLNSVYRRPLRRHVEWGARVVCVWPNGLPLLCAAPPLGLSEKSVEKIVAKQAALGWSAALCPITHCFGPELEMALNTEQEEKRLLREQIHNLEVQTHTRNILHVSQLANNMLQI